MTLKYESQTATFSPDRKYRYTLWRWWSRKPFAMFIGLNPSTADETNDDPTIRRCISFASDWGYGGLCMTNLFAIRATDPKKMIEHPEPIGPDNDAWLLRLSQQAGIVIAAWGTRGVHQHRNEIVCSMIKNLNCLGLTKEGHPRHPLYLPKNVEPRTLKEKK